jgi:hypothetical protein
VKTAAIAIAVLMGLAAMPGAPALAVTSAPVTECGGQAADSVAGEACSAFAAPSGRLQVLRSLDDRPCKPNGVVTVQIGRLTLHANNGVGLMAAALFRGGKTVRATAECASLDPTTRR